MPGKSFRLSLDKPVATITSSSADKDDSKTIRIPYPLKDEVVIDF